MLILIILFIAGYLMWNNFELPVFFRGETVKTEGKIYDISIRRGIRGVGFIQDVKFVYSINKKYYLGTKKVDNRYGIQFIGNPVILEVSKNGYDYKVLGFTGKYSGIKHSKVKYLRSGENEYEEILVENEIFKYKIIEKGGAEQYSLTGIISNVKDTLKVECIKESKLLKDNESSVRIFNKNEKILTFYKNNNELMNLSNMKRYKLLEKEYNYNKLVN